MIRIPPQHNTTNPPGQIINMEMPLQHAIEGYKEETKAKVSVDYIRGYKHGQADFKADVKNLRDTLKYEREQRTHWYMEAMKYKAIVEKHTKFS